MYYAVIGEKLLHLYLRAKIVRPPQANIFYPKTRFYKQQVSQNAINVEEPPCHTLCPHELIYFSWEALNLLRANSSFVTRIHQPLAIVVTEDSNNAPDYSGIIFFLRWHNHPFIRPRAWDFLRTLSISSDILSGGSTVAELKSDQQASSTLAPADG